MVHEASCMVSSALLAIGLVTAGVLVQAEDAPGARAPPVRADVLEVRREIAEQRQRWRPDRVAAPTERKFPLMKCQGWGGGFGRKQGKQGASRGAYHEHVAPDWRARTFHELSRRYGSDKVLLPSYDADPALPTRHNYAPVYERALGGLRGAAEVRVLEIGVFCGSSALLWRDFFGPGSAVFGADVFATNETAIFEGKQPRGVFLTRASQTDAARIGAVAGAVEPHVVVEDGCHSNTCNTLALDAIWPALRGGALYAVEDLLPSERPSGRAHFLRGAAGLGRLSSTHGAEYANRRKCFDVGLAWWLLQLCDALDAPARATALEGVWQNGSSCLAHAEEVARGTRRMWVHPWHTLIVLEKAADGEERPAAGAQPGEPRCVRIPPPASSQLLAQASRRPALMLRHHH